MSDWELHVSRGILDKYDSFDPRQIEAGLDAGLYPQMLIPAGLVDNERAISGLCRYLNKKNLGLPLKIASHGSGRFTDDVLADARNSIDAAIKINDGLTGSTMIGEIIFHAGSVHSVEEEKKIRGGKSYGALAATFSAPEYLDKLTEIRNNIQLLKKYASRNGVELILENVPNTEYQSAPASSLPPESIDPRWENTGGTVWQPLEFQHGLVGCTRDLGFLTDEYRTRLCIDIEHLMRCVDYSKENNMNRNFEYTALSDAELDVLDTFGILVRQGKPILYDREIDPSDFISSIGKENVKIAHICGYAGTSYNDGAVRIGAHMPITFDGDINEYVRDDALLKKISKQQEDDLYTYLKALDEVGCRKGVLEIHLGNDYVGSRWNMYHEISKRNVEYTLSRIEFMKQLFGCVDGVLAQI